MARKVGQIVGRGRRTWLVRVYNGHDPETKKRKYLASAAEAGRVVPGISHFSAAVAWP